MIPTLALLVFACLALVATIAWLSVPYRYPSLDEVLDEMDQEKNVTNQ